MRRDEYLKHLADVPMFRALSKKDLALVARLAEATNLEVARPRGDVTIPVTGMAGKLSRKIITPNAATA